MKINLIGRINGDNLSAKDSMQRYKDNVDSRSVVCKPGTPVTSVVERVDFSLSPALSFNKYYEIPKQIKKKTPKKRHIV